MHAMIKINHQTARAIWGEYDTCEVYVLHDDGTESLLEVEGDDHENFDETLQYGIEGEIFGETYDNSNSNT